MNNLVQEYLVADDCKENPFNYAGMIKLVGEYLEKFKIIAESSYNDFFVKCSSKLNKEISEVSAKNIEEFEDKVSNNIKDADTSNLYNENFKKKLNVLVNWNSDLYFKKDEDKKSIRNKYLAEKKVDDSAADPMHGTRVVVNGYINLFNEVSKDFNNFFYGKISSTENKPGLVSLYNTNLQGNPEVAWLFYAQMKWLKDVYDIITNYMSVITAYVCKLIPEGCTLAQTLNSF